MTTKLVKWASNDSQITKSKLSDGRRAKFLPSVADFAYDWLRTKGYLGNVDTNNHTDGACDLMVDYPANFRAPDYQSNNYEEDVGLFRSKMESGRYRQRRLFKHLPHIFQMTLVLPTDELNAWQTQWMENAYDMTGLTCRSGQSILPGGLSTAGLRTGGAELDLSISNAGAFGFVQITFEMEIQTYVREWYDTNIPTA